jgi:hypothetical protein
MRYKQWSVTCACSDSERQKIRTISAPPHVVEIWAEQERKNAAQHDLLTGLPTLQIAPRYAEGRPRR